MSKRLPNYPATIFIVCLGCKSLTRAVGKKAVRLESPDRHEGEFTLFPEGRIQELDRVYRKWVFLPMWQFAAWQSVA